MKQPPLSKVLKIFVQQIFVQLKWKESKGVLGWIGISVAIALVLTFGMYWLGVGTFNLEAKIRYDLFPDRSFAYWYGSHEEMLRGITNISKKSYADFIEVVEYKRTFNDDDYFGIPDAQPLGYWMLGLCNLIKIIFVLSVLGGIGFGIFKFIKWIQDNWKQAKRIARMEM